MKSRRVFVTGATGFVGSHIVKKLVASGFEVHALCRVRPESDSNVWWHVGNLQDRASLDKAIESARPETVIHCAAYGIRHHEQSPEELITVNIQGTFSLMRVAAHYGVKRWIQTGSCFEYPSQVTPLVETIAPITPNLYGVTKASSTILALQQSVALQMSVTVLRLFTVYGPEEAPTRLIPTLVSASLNSQSVSLSSGTQIRDFIFIEDVAEVYAHLCMTPYFPSGEIFNVGSGIARSLQDVGKVVETLTRKSGLFLWGANPDRPHEHSALVADIQKTKNSLNWAPKTSLEDGISSVIQTFNPKINQGETYDNFRSTYSSTK